jgi:hypothetical protein
MHRFPIFRLEVLVRGRSLYPLANLLENPATRRSDYGDIAVEVGCGRRWRHQLPGSFGGRRRDRAAY